MPDDFAAWACDPKRSLEERFGVEILIERTHGLWRNQQGLPHEYNAQADQLRQKERSLNPAYEPQYTREAAGRAQEVLSQLKSFDNGYFDDRPLRDISFIRFCPPLESLRIHRSEILDWSPLLAHTTLTKLDLGDAVARDLRVIGQLVRLQTLHLWLNAPWPELSGLENLKELRELMFCGNILALQAVANLPELRDAKIQHGGGYNVPLRRVADLPVMPELRRLHLINTADLDGIGQFSKLLNLQIYGYFTDLAPLAELKNLTHLTVSGGDYPTIAPLARIAMLKDLVIRHEEPPDFTPLAEAPCLHEISLEISHIVPPELAALNSLLAPWSDEFAAVASRPLMPLKLYVRNQDTVIADGDPAEPRDWGDNFGMNKSEARWFTREANRRLTALLGEGWGGEDARHATHAGNLHLTICRPEDLDRIPEIVQCLREIIAAARYPWNCFFIVDSEKYYERDMEDIYEAEGETFDPQNARERWEYDQQREREHQEFLERKYRHRLQQELGAQINPADFAPPLPESEDGDTVTAGNFVASEKPEFGLGTDISLFCTLTEKAIYVIERDRGLAELLLEIKAEN
jgi:Leucine-rich repeat (LRR) protein